MTTADEGPAETVAVSPNDGTSDRKQSDRDHKTSAGLLEKVQASNLNIAAGLLALAEAIADKNIADARKEERSDETRRRFYIGTALGILTLIVVMVVGGVLASKVYSNTDDLKVVAAQNRELGKQNQALAEQIKSCIDPNGTCAKRNENSQIAVVKGLNEATVAAIVCASDYGGVPRPARLVAVESCIKQLLGN